MPYFIALLNFKGGTAKTTSVLNIAAAIAQSGRRVLAVDLDPQHNLTQSAGIEPQSTVYDALTNKQPLPVVEIAPGLNIAPNGLEMVKLELELAATVRREYRLQQSLKPHLSNFDYFFFDCPPSLGLITANALFAADKVAVFVPVQAEFLSLKGFAVLNSALENLEMGISKTFVTRYDGRKVLARSVLDSIKNALGERVFKTMIRENVSLAEAPANGMDIFRHAPGSHGAEDYAALTAEIIEYFEK